MKIGMARFAKEGVLASARSAVTARNQIERSIAAQTKGQPIALDFASINAITISFADECIGRLLSSRLAGYDEDHPFLVLNASADVRSTLSAALRPRKLALLSVGRDGVELLGGDEVLIETLMAALRLRNFGVNELANELRLTPQAANNRLVQLVRSGALRRERVIPSRGGREFRYEVPIRERKAKRAATSAA